MVDKGKAKPKGENVAARNGGNARPARRCAPSCLGSFPEPVIYPASQTIAVRSPLAPSTSVSVAQTVPALSPSPQVQEVLGAHSTKNYSKRQRLDLRSSLYHEEWISGTPCGFGYTYPRSRSGRSRSPLGKLRPEQTTAQWCITTPDGAPPAPSRRRRPRTPMA